MFLSGAMGNKFRDIEPNPDEFRVLCIGDSDQETSAALRLASYPYVDKECLRTLKLEEKRSISAMCRQLYYLSRCVEGFAREASFRIKYTGIEIA